MTRLPMCLLCLVVAAVAPAQEAPAPAADLLRMALPADVFVVPGREINIYFDNIVLVASIRNYKFDVTCARGRQDEARWRFTPTAEDVGDHPLSVKAVDGMNRALAEASTTVHVIAADAGAGEEISLLCVGDSLTHASVYPAELLKLCESEGNPKLRLIGTHRPNVSLPEVVHEGYGGWAWATFCTRWTEGDDVRARSPFLRVIDGKPTLDFQHYCDVNNGGAGPDFITVMLGCNDTFGASDDGIEARIDRMFGYADMLLGEFQRVRADTQIGLFLLVPPAASQDGFGANYQCGQTRWQYRRNQHRVVERMMEKFGGREAGNLFLIPAHLNLDTAHNFLTTQEPTNSRSEEIITRQSNGVHPARAGYRQIADTIYYWVKGRLAGGRWPGVE